MTTPDCPRTTLVEALRDGRLGPQESASMERHLEGCAVCSELAGDLDKIGHVVRAPRETLTQLEHQRARVALLQRAAMQAPLRVTSSGPRFAFGAVLMAAAVILGFWGGRWNSGPDRVAVALHMGALPIPTNNSKLGLHASDDARFQRNRTADLDELTLEHGVIEVKLQKLETGKRFVVRTKDAQIDVRATAFRVEAEGGRIRSVAVEQGTVEVQYAGFTAVIPAGGSWRATAESPDLDKPAAKTETEMPTPAAATTTASAPATSSVVATGPKTPRTPKSQPAFTDIFEPEKLEAVRGREIVAPPPVVNPPDPPAPNATITAPAALPSPASRTFAEAMAAMRRGDYAGSADKLAQFAQTHAGDARADEADYLRAIALQRAGKHDAAIAAAKRYLASRPNGAHRADAARIAGK